MTAHSSRHTPTRAVTEERYVVEPSLERPRARPDDRLAVTTGAPTARALRWQAMAYSASEARRQLLDDVAQAIDAIGLALAALGDAFEQLDEYNAEKLEEELFRPVQLAYGRAKRTHAEFAERHGLPTRTFESASPGLPSAGVKGFVERAVEAVGEADRRIATLQDSMMPVEVGDAELRAGLSEVRRLIGDVPGRARRFVSVLGR
ncbi:MAG: hypothetical protein QOC78_702 [Solirubrobacteraceae bacterium]|jgi:hypothetical protein|nr:hypothetical protein [Solirubrobacteraceae bacterium]